MLSNMRRLTRGWVAAVILGLLALAFVVFGIPNTLRPAASISDKVVSGQGVGVTAAEFLRTYERQFQAIQSRAAAQNQPPVTRDAAIKGGFPSRIAETLASETALKWLANKLGVQASDSLVLEAIRKDPSFVSQVSGEFDPTTYRSLLQQNQMTEIEYQEQLRAALRRSQVQQALTAGVRPPSSYGKLIYLFETERRTLAVAAIPAERVGPIAAPTDAELTAFYEQQKQAFALPEYRALTIVTADPADFESKVEVSDAKVQEQFKYEESRRSVPERRSFVQISGAADKAAAETAAARLVKGEDPAKIAAEMKLQVLTVTEKTAEEAPDPRVAAAVFALQPGQTTGAVQGLSWSAARLVSITPAHKPTLEELAPAIRSELVRQEAQALMDEAVEKFENAREEGAAFDAAARAAGLSLSAVLPVDQRGLTPQGQPAEALLDAADVLREAFTASEGEPTDWLSGENGLSRMVRVDSVKPAGPPDLASVRGPVSAAYRAQKIGAGMRALAEEVQAAVAAGKPLEVVAREKRIPLAGVQTFDRQSAQQSPSPDLMSAAFSAAEGSVVTGLATDGRPVLFVAQVQKIERPDLSTQTADVERRRAAFAESLRVDLGGGIDAFARERAKIKVDTARINLTLGVDDAPAGDKP